jgi:membrane fusion protein, multidrug efflux system
LTEHDSLAAREQQAIQPAPPRNLRRAGLIAAAIAIVIAASGLLLRWFHLRQVSQWTDARAVPTVAVLTPQRGVTGLQTVLPGNIQAWYEAPIYARVNGYLKNWYFDYGAHVKKGQVLAAIDTPDLDAELNASLATLKSAVAQTKVREAEMDFAKTTYVRWRDSPQGVVSEQEREQKKADFNSAQARYNASLADVNSDQGRVDNLKALEGFKLLVTPFDGIVTQRNTDIGALINAGSGSGNVPQLFRVADVHEMRVFVQVPQEISGSIRPGLSADLHLPQYPDRVFKAAVATTSEAINESARTLLVELHADNSQGLLQPGTYAEVHFELPNDPHMVRVPTSALIFRQDGMQVAVLGPGNHIELRPVKLGKNLGTDVEVLAGITPEDRVVDSPADSLADNEVVSIESGPAQPSSPALAQDGAKSAAHPADPDPPGKPK